MIPRSGQACIMPWLTPETRGLAGGVRLRARLPEGRNLYHECRAETWGNGGVTTAVLAARQLYVAARSRHTPDRADGHPLLMTGLIPVAGGRVVKSGGKSGVVFDEPPEAQAFSRWQNGKFLEFERQFARVWREGLTSLDLNAQRHGRIAGRFRTGRRRRPSTTARRQPAGR
jgi:hypothetical protein